jgi:lipid A 3-O-deacylase
MLLTTTLTIATILPTAGTFSLAEDVAIHGQQAQAQRTEAMAALEATLDTESQFRIAPAMFQSDSTDTTGSAAVATFGSEGSMRWGLVGGWGIDAKSSSNNEAAFGATWEYFIVDGFAFAPELKLWGFFQDGGNAFGGSLDLLFAWHFVRQDTWSFFVDGGVGLLGSTKNVPIGGSEFNFTPQAGVGVTFDIGDNNRWVVGVRWHHISNAGLYSENPGRDSVYIYTGINFPF